MSPPSPEQTAAAARRACDEISRRLRAGDDCRSEEFLAAQPALAADSDAALELLYTEFVVREELGQQPQPASWLQRFPHWHRELSQLFEIHALVDGGETHAQKSFETQRDDSPAHATLPGANQAQQTIGNYEILREIGRGGMGIVYEARQRGLGRLVALKTILPPHGERERARFRAEAEATARLSHPHIVPIYEVGQDGDTPYLSMEYVAGQSLDKRLTESVLSPRAAAELLVSLTQAVAHAHSQGIIHRDLKPANVLLKAEGERMTDEPESPSSRILHPSSLTPKITDFGLAKSLDGNLTQGQSVAIVGTPSYMAPEQCTPGSSVSAAVDIYSLGAILYECLTGRPPFRGSTALDILELVRTRDPVPPSQLAAHIPRDLETICLKCLAKLPDQRYASAQSLTDDLQRFLADEPIVARPISRAERSARWCRRNPLVAALLGGIALILLAASITSTSLAVWAFREKSRADQHAQQELAARELAEQRFSQAEDAVGKYLDGIENDPRLQEADFHDLRRDLLASAVPFYEEFVASKPGNAELEANRGRAYGRLGFIRKQMGELEAATADYERMRDIFTRLAASDNVYRRELAQSYHQLGSTLYDRGQLPEAEAEFQRSLALSESLARELPGDHTLEHRVAVAHRSLGVLWRRLSRRAEAEKALREALRRMETLAQAHPEIVRYQEDIAGLHTFLGNVLPAEPREAREDHYRRSVELYKSLANSNPTRTEHRFGLATARNNLGALHDHHRQHEAALVELEQALELRKQLAADFPAVPTYQRLLAMAHHNLGMSLKGVKRWDDAEKEIRTAIALLDQLATKYSDAPENLRNLAFAHEEQATVLQALGRPAESEREQRAALRLRQQIAAEYPAVPLNRELLAKCHTTLAATLYRVDRYAESEAEFAAAIALHQQYADAFPENQEQLRQFALCLEQHAQALLRLNQRPPAVAAYRQAVALWTERLLASVGSPDQHFEAGRASASLAALLDKTGELSEASEFFELAAARHQQALDGAPTNPSYANALWKDYFEIASVNVRRKNHAGAAAAAVKLAAVRPASGEDAVWAARYFGRCVVLAAQDTRIPAADRHSLSETYAENAMDFLHEAVRRGYRDTAALTKLEALAPLTQRQDFQQLLAEPRKP